jgi:uncharacterized protein (TIGR00251 family)
MSGKPAAEPALQIRVIPRSPRTRVDGMRGDAVLIRLAAPPVDGAANDALVAFLAGALGVPRHAVRIVAGARSRDKRVAVDGLSPADVRAALGLR